MMGKLMVALGACACMAFALACAAAATPEFNPVRGQPGAIGPAASRVIVAFRATSDNMVVHTIHTRLRAQTVQSSQAGTTASDVANLMQRARLKMARSRQLTPSTHVIYLQQTLYGSAVDAALALLRTDPAVKFAEADQRRYPQVMPDDPLFVASTNGAGQWYMMTPSAVGDAAATDAVSAWAITTGSTGTVIADIDTGVRFDHPDLLRAGFGGRLLPGYDFVGADLSTTGASLGTYLIANDGDGWDPDPSDPGDWINASDQTNALFPATDCPVADSTWHGTRVMGILGALTNNNAGIAGMTWNPYLLPVRALGKCGGYDSDIIAGMEWAAGMPVTGVPDNPFPADIINLSLGSSGACPSDYADAITTLTAMGVLIVASAGNQSGPVDAPGNCPGVLAVAGLRNVGTKVGYSSLGPQIAVAAPAGNCVNPSGPCLRSIDTTSNTGLTVPSDNTYTTETNPNLGTSFSAPIVAGIVALMRSVNANLTPAQLIDRIETSAVPFPQPVGLPVCPTLSADGTGECACPNDRSQCGAGMVNALNAVNAAQRPIAAVLVPAATGMGSSGVLDASGSAASCGRTIVGYAWSANGGATIPQGSAGAARITVTATGTAGTISLTVTDSAGATDTATLSVGANGAITASATTPATAGTDATACSTAASINPAAPTVAEAFSPASVGENAVSTLTITLLNSNGFDLTQSALSEALPANLTMATTSSSASLAPATTCAGASSALTTTANTVALSNANIPAQGSCVITVPVQSAMPGTYTNPVPINALSTGPAGGNKTAATATLTVTPPSQGGGGAVDGWDVMFAVGVILACRRRPTGERRVRPLLSRRPPQARRAPAG